jgi:hypothetical protein
VIAALVATFTLAAGWTIGYRMRPLVPPAPGCPCTDEAAIAADTAFIAELRARFDAIVAGFNDKDQAA